MPGELLIGAMCIGSTCRSPQILGTVRHQLEQRGIRAKVRSFGSLDALKKPVDKREPHHRAAQPHSISIMRERGIDITDHVPAHVSDVEIEHYDLVLVADPGAYTVLTETIGFPKEKAILLNAPDGVYNPFDSTVADLLKQDLEKYRKTAAQLDEIMPAVIDEHIMPLAQARGLI